MSRRKRHSDADEMIKIYPDVIPGRARGSLNSQSVSDNAQNGVKVNAAKSDDTIRNNRGWSG